jgi:Ni/Fe-hydrogenase subunit HybB-like protein
MRKIVITGLVAVHLAATLWHGNLHSRLSINLSPWQTLFIILVILMAPIVAAALVWTRYVSTGLWVFFLSMLAAFLFGAYHHYVMVSPDNINFLPGTSAEDHYQFAISAGAIALLELGSALYGAFCLGSRRALSRADAQQTVGRERRERVS